MAYGSFSYADIDSMINETSQFLIRYSMFTTGRITYFKFVDVSTDHTYLVQQVDNEIISLGVDPNEDTEIQCLQLN